MVIEFYYHVQSPPSCCVWMVLKDLGIEYKGHAVDLMTDEHKSADFKKLNPNMQVPTIKDGDLVLSESRAICAYLCQKYEKADKKEKLHPRDPVEVAKFSAMLFRDVDNYNRMLHYMNWEAILEGRAKGVEVALLPKAKEVLAEYESLLAERDYVFGKHLTFLDFFYAHTVAGMAITGFDKWEDYPNLKKWKQRLEKLSYFEECLKQSVEMNKKFGKELIEKGPAVFAELQQKKS